MSFFAGYMKETFGDEAVHVTEDDLSLLFQVHFDPKSGVWNPTHLRVLFFPCPKDVNASTQFKGWDARWASPYFVQS